MRLIPHSFNGFYFQQKNRVVGGWSVPYDWTIAGVSTSAIARSQNFPSYAVKNYAGSLKFIKVTFNSIDTDRDSLVIAMDILGEDQHQLIALDELGRAWYLNAVCLGMTEEAIDENTASFNVVFDTDDPIWKKLIPSTKSISMFYGTGSETMTPLGNQPALPIITVTPISSGTFSFTYKRYIQVINKSTWPLINFGLNLTGSGLDTATLIAGGKMLANGDDLRIYVDGVEVPRWFGGGGIDSATTKIFINWNQPRNTAMLLGTAIAGSGDVSTINFVNENNTWLYLPTVPASGGVKIGNEIFIYTGVDVSGMRLTGVTRAERETTEAAHSAGDSVEFVTHDVWMYYGYAGITPYIADDTYKPIIDLATSDNQTRVYSDFGSVSELRSDGWKKSGSAWYTGYEKAIDTDPYETIGTFSKSNWTLYTPCGANYITVLGRKRWDGSFFWDTGMQKSLNGTTWSLAWAEPAPVALNTWSDLATHTNVDLLGDNSYIKLYGFPGGGELSTLHEFDSVTVVGNAAKIPAITVSAEITIFLNLYSVFHNDATGFDMTLGFSLQSGQTVVVDTKNKTIKLNDGSNQINAMIDMPVRSEWFPLLPAQANLITITEAADVDFAFSYEDRSL